MVEGGNHVLLMLSGGGWPREIYPAMQGPLSKRQPRTPCVTLFLNLHRCFIDLVSFLFGFSRVPQ